MAKTRKVEDADGALAATTNALSAQEAVIALDRPLGPARPHSVIPTQGAAHDGG
ncbi:hypothetical protein ACRBEV_01495 [Methylobacterium phyllosphaerae]